MITFTLAMKSDVTSSYPGYVDTAKALAALVESGAELGQIQITPPVRGEMDDQRNIIRQHEPQKLTVTFREPMRAAMFLATLNDDQDRAAQFKLFWGGE